MYLNSRVDNKMYVGGHSNGRRVHTRQGNVREDQVREGQGIVTEFHALSEKNGRTNGRTNGQKVELRHNAMLKQARQT